MRLRVLCYNIHHAAGVDGKLDVPRIARVIQSVKPDLVALQEVDRNTTRTGKVDQAAELAQLTRMNHVFGANIAFQGGQYGTPFFAVSDYGASESSVAQRGCRRTTWRVGGDNSYVKDRSLRLLATHLIIAGPMRSGWPRRSSSIN